ncbi:unnamed protein product, partial [Meganyctiphanes norvegica]
MERRIKLKTLNEHIVCAICSGYLVDATTVTECLHTFCKSCLVKHLEERNTCPNCDIVIHQSHPLNYISFDRTMQDIVFKLVPNLQPDRVGREQLFLTFLRPLHPQNIQSTKTDTIQSCCDNSYPLDKYQLQNQVNICLECVHPTLAPLKRRFIRCSAQATITHLKKFLALKVLEGPQKYREIDILCNDEMLGKDHTLKFVQVTRWRFHKPPLKLTYRPRIDI